MAVVEGRVVVVTETAVVSGLVDVDVTDDIVVGEAVVVVCDAVVVVEGRVVVVAETGEVPGLVDVVDVDVTCDVVVEEAVVVV